MKDTIHLCLFLCVSLSFFPTPLFAQDMRQINQEAEVKRQILYQKAALEKKEAIYQAEQSRSLILTNRSKLEKTVSELKTRKIALEQQVVVLGDEQTRLAEKEGQLTREIADTSQMVGELVGVVRLSAKDIEAIVRENLQSSFQLYPEFLAAIGDESSFPGMDNIKKLADTLFEQISVSSQVQRLNGPIIDRNGNSVQAEILLLGPFCAAYRLGEETGFLRYSSSGTRLYALTKLPPTRMQKQIHRYLNGQSESITMDIGRGAALQQLSHSLSLLEQIEEGGPIVWPILAILALGLLIILERVFFLLRKRLNSEGFMQRLAVCSTSNEWQECETFCEKYRNKPIARVIQAGLQYRTLQREEMENILQEAILREIPPMERFLSTLGMLAAIAPLLGLLGTVTGMIDTFHVITLHGTSDPRLMSGGISEALVTTMLGLGVAIPLMLAQTLLNRSIEKEIGTMEEKAVALVNLIHKHRLEKCTL